MAWPMPRAAPGDEADLAASGRTSSDSPSITTTHGAGVLDAPRRASAGTARPGRRRRCGGRTSGSASPGRGRRRGRRPSPAGAAIRPTPRIAHSGGLMIGVNASMPNAPRFVTVKLPPCMSLGGELAAPGALDQFARPRGELPQRRAPARRGPPGRAGPRRCPRRCRCRCASARTMPASVQRDASSGCFWSATAASFTRRSVYDGTALARRP